MDTLKEILQKILDNATKKTDEELNSELSSLIRLTDSELKDILSIGITKPDLVKVIKEVKDATKSNHAKAIAINNLNGGMVALVSIVNKFL